MDKTLLERWEELYNQDSDLHERQDDDLLLYDLDPYTLMKSDGITQVSGAYNLTSSRPKTFANRVKGALEDSDLQIEVTKMDGTTDDMCARIEEMLRVYIYPLINSFLRLKGYPELLEVLAGQIAVRGGIAGVVSPYLDGGSMIPHVIPWDYRYQAHGSGGIKGFSLAGYKTYRSSDMIEEEYKYEGLGNAEKAMVADVWTPEEHEVWIKNEKLKEVINNKGNGDKHNLGYTPVPIHKCSANIWHQSEGWEDTEAESVFGESRDVFPAMNQLLTIVNTLTVRAFTAGLQFRNEAGAEAVIEGDPREDDQTNAIGLQDKFESMPLNDIKAATLMLREILENDILFATLPAMEYGEMSDQETVAQITTKSSKTRSFLKPRKRAIEAWLDDMAYMFMQQVEAKGLPHQITLRGRTTKFKFYALGDYLIKHTLNIRSPQQDIANAALADALGKWLDLETLLQNIIQVDDPTGVIRKKEREDIERLMPQIVAMRVAVEKLKSKDDQEKAEGTMIALELGMSAQPNTELVGPNGEPIKQMPTGNGANIMKLTG